MRAIVRNMRSSFVSMIGLAFALAFVLGTMIAIDTIHAISERYSNSTSLADDDGSAHIMSWNSPGWAERRLFAAAMSLPAIAVGIIVSVAGANLGISMRADEVKQLRSKGTSDKDIFHILMMEAVIIGLVAAFIALIIASLIGIAIMDSILKFIFDADTDFRTSWRMMTISGGTAFYAVLSGVGLSLLVSLGPSKRMSNLFLPEEGRPPRRDRSAGLGPLLDVILIALSLASIIDILSGGRWEWSHGFDYYTGSFDAFFGAIGLLLFPAMPFMLAVGVGGLLTRKPIMLHKRVGRWFAASDQRPDLKEEDPVDRRRAVRACLLVALVLTFGMFASVTTQSMLEHDKAVVRFNVGADVQLSGSYSGYPNGSQWEPPLELDHLDEISSVPGVSSVTVLEHFVPRIDGEYVSAIMIDPEDYLATVKPDVRYFDDRGSDELLELGTPGAALVNGLYAEEFGVVLDEVCLFHVITVGATADEVLDWYVNVTVVGFVDDLPAAYANLLVSYETMSVIPSFNLDMASNGIAVIIDVQEGHDQSEVAAAAGLLVQEAGITSFYTMTLEGEYAHLSDNSEYGGMSDLLAGEYVYLLLVIMFGIGMVFYISILQARARPTGVGPQGTQVPGNEKVVLGESVGVIAVGSAVGVGAALLTIYLFNMMWVPTGWEPVPRDVSFTLASVVTAVVSIAGLLIVPFVSASLAKRTPASITQQPRGWL